MTHAPLVLPLSGDDGRRFGQRALVGRHGLESSDLFDDAALVELLDRFPRERLYAMSMGNDPQCSDDSRLALHAGVTGLELLRAVRRGRLWLNLTHVDQADERYRRLIDRLYAELAGQVNGLQIDSSQCTLLIASPQAIVHYHADGPASVLWHVRGRKRVWTYPAGDLRYVARDDLEDIFAGARHEYLPFDPAFDAAAEVHDLEPGEWMTWPQNAPHRISNLEGLNVSLSTEHFTPQTRRRARVHIANRFLRLRAGLHGLSQREDGAGAFAKVAIHRIARQLGLDRTASKQHRPTLRIDPDAPGGVVPLAAPDQALA